MPEPSAASARYAVEVFDAAHSEWRPATLTQGPGDEGDDVVELQYDAPSSPDVGGGGNRRRARGARPRTRLHLSQVIPRAAVCALSRGLRARLQLTRVESRELTYGSHSAPTPGWMTPLPCPIGEDAATGATAAADAQSAGSSAGVSLSLPSAGHGAALLLAGRDAPPPLHPLAAHGAALRRPLERLAELREVLLAGEAQPAPAPAPPAPQPRAGQRKHHHRHRNGGSSGGGAFRRMRHRLRRVLGGRSSSDSSSSSSRASFASCGCDSRRPAAPPVAPHAESSPTTPPPSPPLLARDVHIQQQQPHHKEGPTAVRLRLANGRELRDFLRRYVQSTAPPSPSSSESGGSQEVLGMGLSHGPGHSHIHGQRLPHPPLPPPLLAGLHRSTSQSSDATARPPGAAQTKPASPATPFLTPREGEDSRPGDEEEEERETHVAPHDSRRWEAYVRYDRDPRNDLRFADIPLFLWHSLRHVSSSVAYCCERVLFYAAVAPVSPTSPGKRLAGSPLGSSARTLASHSPTSDRWACSSPSSLSYSRRTTSIVVTPPLVTTASEGLGSHEDPTAWGSAAGNSGRRGGGGSGGSVRLHDSFLLLTETHVVCINSFGEAHCRCNYRELQRLTFWSGGAGRYPFVVFEAMESSVDYEPPLVITLTFTPLVPPEAGAAWDSAEILTGLRARMRRFIDLCRVLLPSLRVVDAEAGPSLEESVQKMHSRVRPLPLKALGPEELALYAHGGHPPSPPPEEDCAWVPGSHDVELSFRLVRSAVPPEPTKGDLFLSALSLSSLDNY